MNTSSVISSKNGANTSKPQLVHGRSWGPWVLDAERLTLVFRGESVDAGEGSHFDYLAKPYVAYCGLYELDLETIYQSSELLDWIFQIRGKGWATASVLKDLLSALHEIFHPQQNLCSGGANKVIANPRELLRARIAAPPSSGDAA